LGAGREVFGEFNSSEGKGEVLRKGFEMHLFVGCRQGIK